MSRLALGTAWTSAALLVAVSAVTPALADDSGPFEFGAFAGGHFFSANNELGARDVSDAAAPDDSFGLGLRLGYWLLPVLGIEAEAAVLPTESTIGESEQTILAYRLSGIYQMDMGRIQPFGLLGVGWMSNSSERDEVLLDDTDLVPQLGIGAKAALGDDWGVRADARLLLPPSSESEGLTTDFELWLGVYRQFGADKPPAAPGDSDGDGIFDDRDGCPKQAEDPDGFEDEDGCPDLDNDRDGIADGSDKCPDQPETQNGIEDEDGCPEGDEDGDGIVGPADRCPTEPEDRDGFEDEDGCPDPDNDGDGVMDPDDRCPAEPETMNGYEDDDGCPDVVPEKVKKFTGVIKGINFKVNSAELTPDSSKTLDEAVAIMKEYPALRIEIQGHTDDTGSRDYNMDLSRRRAETVRQYFVSKGIDESRTTSVGYGPDKPIDPAKTQAARAKNRRVEFRLITGAESKGAGSPPPAEQPSESGSESGPESESE